jgi:hypothetical protein
VILESVHIQMYYYMRNAYIFFESLERTLLGLCTITCEFVIFYNAVCSLDISHTYLVFVYTVTQCEIVRSF